MSSWILVADLGSLRDEFNALAPNRDKASDGSIGDQRHAQESSDHNPDETGRTPSEDSDNINEVHAIDVDDDLNSSMSMEEACDIIRVRHQDGRDNRLQNIIYTRRITSRSWGWVWRAYTGVSPHTEHAHFSSRYGSGSTIANPENDTRPWGLLEEGDNDMPSVGQIWAATFGPASKRETAGERLGFVDETVEKLEAQMTDVQSDLTEIKALLTSLVPKTVAK